MMQLNFGHGYSNVVTILLKRSYCLEREHLPPCNNKSYRTEVFSHLRSQHLCVINYYIVQMHLVISKNYTNVIKHGFHNVLSQLYFGYGYNNVIKTLSPHGRKEHLPPYNNKSYRTEESGHLFSWHQRIISHCILQMQQ